MLTMNLTFDLSTFDHQVETYLTEDWRPRAKAAIDETLRLVRARLSAETERVLDRPTPYTVQAFGQLPADAAVADPEGQVFVYDNQARWLSLEILGGERRAGDHATTRRGPLIPLPGAVLNSYGNLPRNMIRDAIQRGAFWRRSRLHPDREVLVERDAGGLSFIAEIIPEATYRPRFDFAGIVVDEVSKRLPAAIERAWADQ